MDEWIGDNNTFGNTAKDWTIHVYDGATLENPNNKAMGYSGDTATDEDHAVNVTVHSGGTFRPGQTGTYGYPFSTVKDLTFDGGAFASGELLVFGQQPKALDAAAFADLRGKFPMVAVRTDAGAAAGVAALYPAGDAASVKVQPSITYTNGDFDPVARALGALGSFDVPNRFGISCGGLKYSVSFAGGDGARTDLGVVTAKRGGGRVTGVVSGKDTMAKLRGLLAERGRTTTDRISDRDVVDFWLTGTYEFKGGK